MTKHQVQVQEHIKSKSHSGGRPAGAPGRKSSRFASYMPCKAGERVKVKVKRPEAWTKETLPRGVGAATT